MTVSIPIDIETLEEMEAVIEEAAHVDLIDYRHLLNTAELTDYFLKGFCILAYSNESDQLVGVLTAVDRLATLDYEWSAVVLPSARKLGIGKRMLQELDRNLELRGATSDIALVANVAKTGQYMLAKRGYSYELSEITMVAKVDPIQADSSFEVMPFEHEEEELIEVLKDAFDDTEEEAKEMIAFSVQTPNRKLMLAKQGSKVVGTTTIVENGEELWITGLGVRKEAQGKGVATALLNWSKYEAYKLGKTAVYLDVETDNDIALSIYEKQGFQTVSNTLFFRRNS